MEKRKVYTKNVRGYLVTLGRKPLTYFKLVIFLALVLFPLLSGVQTNALAAQPDSSPIISEIHVNTYLVVTGDQFHLFEYNIPYATPPTESVDSTFIFQLLSTDGTTELGRVTPFPYFDRGYNEGICGFYFSASGAPTWGENYIIRVSENPIYFATPTHWDFIYSGSEYTTLTTQPDNQADLADHVITIARHIETATSTTLLATSASYTILYQPTGETYFRGAIHGLQAMSPSLFLVQSLPIDLTPKTWTTTKFDAYAGRFEGTWVGDIQTATGDQFGMPGSMAMGLMIALPVCLGAIIFSSLKFRKTEPGLMAAACLMIMLVLLGWLPQALFAIVYQSTAIYSSFILFYSRG